MSDKKWCPLIRKNCVEHKCAWYMQIMGYNPNTGQDVNEWGCAVGWIPSLVIEASAQGRSTASAVESFRNEVVKANDQNKRIYIEEALKNNGVIPTTVTPLTNYLTEGEDEEQ